MSGRVEAGSGGQRAMEYRAEEHSADLGCSTFQMADLGCEREGPNYYAMSNWVGPGAKCQGLG